MASTVRRIASTGRSARPTTTQITTPSSTLPDPTITINRRTIESRTSDTLAADRATTRVSVGLVGTGFASTRRSPSAGACTVTTRPSAATFGPASTGNPCAAVLAPITFPSGEMNWT